MSKEFSYPEFENGVKVLSRAGDAVNDMMMNNGVPPESREKTDPAAGGG